MKCEAQSVVVLIKRPELGSFRMSQGHKELVLHGGRVGDIWHGIGRRRHVEALRLSLSAAAVAVAAVGLLDLALLPFPVLSCNCNRSIVAAETRFASASWALCTRSPSASRALKPSISVVAARLSFDTSNLSRLTSAVAARAVF